jgi:serine/threonine protein phosphatase PrpC
MVVDQQIANDMAMSDLQAATRKLVIDALEGGGSDNITTVTVRVTGEPPHRDLEEGAEQIRIARPSLIKKLRGLFS